VNPSIEVEIRGPLSKKDKSRVEAFLKKHGRFVTKKERTLIDYSAFLKGGGIRNRTTDIRLRETNGVPEIIVKLGKWGGMDERKEISVLTLPGSFDNLTEVFAILGLKKGMLCKRRSTVYMFKGIEFALVEVPGHSYYFEAETMVSKGSQKAAARKKIEKVCKDLEISAFTDKQYFAYIKELNEKVNEVFEYGSSKI
jgi:predicted adenylyl cyclase CyaB